MKKRKNKRKWVKPRHKLIFVLLIIFVLPIIKLIFGYKCQKFKIKKNEKYIVLANHQTTLDPVFVGATFNKLLYYVSNDDLLHLKWKSRLLSYCFGIIGKSKGKSDFLTVKTMLQVLKENGSVCVFPEGNRTFSGSLCYINPAITKFVKSAKTPVILYNIDGGYGVDPRWGLKRRKGHFYGSIKRILSVEEIASLSIDELHNVIIDELNVNTAPSSNEYLSDKSAEKIERVLYICPECGKKHMIHSEGNYFKCANCNTVWEYTKNLTIKTNDKLYKYKTVNEWYNYQLEDIRKTNYQNTDLIFKDDEIEIYESVSHKDKELLLQGSVILEKDKITLKSKNKEFSFLLSTLEGVAASGKQQIIFRRDESVYTIQNNKEKRNDFNALKYVLTINYIKTKEEGKDEFFGI